MLDTCHRSEVAQSCLTLHDPMDTRLLRPWDFLGKSTGVGCLFLLQGTSRPRDRTQVSHIVADALPSEPPGKSKMRLMGHKNTCHQPKPAFKNVYRNIKLQNCSLKQEVGEGQIRSLKLTYSYIYKIHKQQAPTI